VVDGFKIFLSTTHNATIVPTRKESCMGPSISDLRLSITKGAIAVSLHFRDEAVPFSGLIWSVRTCPRFESGDMSPQAKNLP
jgi:hypothetical protein